MLLHTYHFVWRPRNPPCTPASRLPWGKTRPRWPAVCCTWCRRSSAGDKQSPAPSAQPVSAGCPADTMHILYQNVCRKTWRRERERETPWKNLWNAGRVDWWKECEQLRLKFHTLHDYFFICSQEWWHSVCINRNSSCWGGKNHPWNVFLLTVDLLADW